MPLNSGDFFAGFRIVRLLGSGGMGEVYLAQHPRLPRQDALKVLPPDVSADPQYRARFLREADLACTLYHPHIVGVHDRGEYDGQLWISMDYIEGPDAWRILRDRYPTGMPPQEVVEIISAVADALDYAHENDLLHRDVKPANILLTKHEPKNRRPLLADFGIARNMNDIRNLTQPAVAVGTLAYAAPEQLNGLPVDARADQYALAATAYHLFTGSILPNGALPNLAATRANLAPLAAVLAVALAKDRNDRYASCADFARNLASPSGAPTAASPSRDRVDSILDFLELEPPLPRPQPKAGEVKVQRSRSPRNANKRTGGIAHLLETFLLTAAIASAIWLLVASGLGARVWQGLRSAIDTNSRSVTSTPTSVAPSITFERMRDFLAGYYGHLPANPEAAWAMVAPNDKDQTSHKNFVDFWATIQSVTVVSISPRDATSVVARLRYVRRSGQTDAEDRWFKMVLVNGTLLLDESQRIGKVNEPSTTSTTSSTTTAPRPPLAERDLDGLLLGPGQINTVMGATGMTVAGTFTSHAAGNLSDQACLPLSGPGQSTDYADSFSGAMRAQDLHEPGDRFIHFVQQDLVLFPSAQDAVAFFTASTQSWPACANRQYTEINAGQPDKVWTVGPVSDTNGTLSATKTMGDNYWSWMSCQRALTVTNNVAIDVEACTRNSSESESDSAVNIAHQIAAIVATR
jgi:serine/threonine-protein kinase